MHTILHGTELVNTLIMAKWRLRDAVRGPLSQSHLVIKARHEMIIGALNGLESIFSILPRHAVITIRFPLVWVELEGHLPVCQLNCACIRSM